MIEGGVWVHGTFLVYFVLMMGIGVIAWRRTSNLSDYFLGGRKLGRWVTALSTQATAMSGWLLLGLPGFAYLHGVNALWMAGGLVLGTYLNWKLVARRLRERTAGLDDALTLPVYLERRFRDQSGVLRVVSALFILVFFTLYTASGLAAGGKLFEAVFGWPYLWAAAGGALVIIGYTFLGGFLAVSWTDTIQGMLMWLALLAVAVLGTMAAGGASGVADAMRGEAPELLSLWRAAGDVPLGVIGILSLAGWGLGYFGQPHVMARFMAIRSVDRIPGALRIAMSWIVVAMLASMVVGWVGMAHVTPPLVGADAEKVFMVLTAELLPPVIAGVCLAGILAAIMSTADSQLLVASSAFTEDLFARMFAQRPDPGRLVWLSRSAVVGIAAVAFLLAMDPESRVLDLVAYAWAGLGATFGPAVLLSLYWAAMSRAGAFAGVVTGGACVILWRQFDGGLFDLYELVPAFVLSMAAIVLGSLMRPDDRSGPEMPLPVADDSTRAYSPVMRRILTSIFLVSMLAGCAVEPAREDVSPDEELTQLVDWMSGRFEAPARGGADSVRAPRHMGVIPFRGERDGERWLYVAQWNAEGERPERRLVYRLERGSGNLIFADLFEVSRPDDLPALPGPEMLDALTADDLRRRRGCRIWLSRDEVSFTGGTRGADCASRYRGAARVRIELVIRQNETVEWLQGFDSGGARLWGGDAGARVYRRVRSQVTSDQIPPRSRSEPENETATSVSFAFSIACANNTGGTPLCRAKTLN